MHEPVSIPRGNEDLASWPTVFAAGLLSGQTVLVSGAGSGMGRCTAWLAARLGARVIVAGRTEAKLAAVVDGITAGQVSSFMEALLGRCFVELLAVRGARAAVVGGLG